MKNEKSFIEKELGSSIAKDAKFLFNSENVVYASGYLSFPREILGFSIKEQWFWTAKLLLMYNRNSTFCN